LRDHWDTRTDNFGAEAEEKEEPFTAPFSLSSRIRRSTVHLATLHELQQKADVVHLLFTTKFLSIFLDFA
jgi:hypothetical protein